MDNKKSKAFEDAKLEVEQILNETRKKVIKLREDIQQLRERGTLELHFTPPGMKYINEAAITRGEKALDQTITGAKFDASKQVDKATSSLLPEEQRELKQLAEKTIASFEMEEKKTPQKETLYDLLKSPGKLKEQLNDMAQKQQEAPPKGGPSLSSFTYIEKPIENKKEDPAPEKKTTPEISSRFINPSKDKETSKDPGKDKGNDKDDR